MVKMQILFCHTSYTECHLNIVSSLQVMSDSGYCIYSTQYSKRPLFVPKSISGKCSVFHLKYSVLVQTFCSTKALILDPSLHTWMHSGCGFKKQSIYEQRNKPTKPQNWTHHTLWLTHSSEGKMCVQYSSAVWHKGRLHTFSKMHGQKGEIVALSLGRCSLPRCDQMN